MVPRSYLAFAVILACSVAKADGPPVSESMTMSPKNCRYLAQFYPEAGLTAAPVDAYGRPVAPADEAPQFRPPAIKLLVEAPTIEKRTWRSEPRLVELTIDLATGEITANGAPVPGLTSADLI